MPQLKFLSWLWYKRHHTEHKQRSRKIRLNRRKIAIKYHKHGDIFFFYKKACKQIKLINYPPCSKSLSE